MYDKMPPKRPSDTRVIARLDASERALVRRARALTGKNTSEVIKAALRAYAQSLPAENAAEIFARCGVIGAVSGPTDLSETYKAAIDYSGKHGGEP